MKTPTPSALDTAFRNGQRKANQYAVEWDDIFIGAATVRALDGHSRYGIWLPGILPSYPLGNCRCPYFEKTGTCLHLCIAAEDARIREMEAAQEVAADEFAALGAERSVRPVGNDATRPAPLNYPAGTDCLGRAAQF